MDKRRKIADEVAEVNGLITNEEALHRSEFLFLIATSKPIQGLAAPKRYVAMHIWEHKWGMRVYMWHSKPDESALYWRAQVGQHMQGRTPKEACEVSKQRYTMADGR